MIQYWTDPRGLKRMLFFSPLSEHTNIFDDTLKLQIIVSRYNLIEKGWKPL